MAKKTERGQRCGAKRRDGLTCLNRAMDNGRCRMHGGKSTGNKDKTRMIGNKINLKTGETETVSIFNKFFTDEEKRIYNSLPDNILEIINEEIKILTMREVRMMERIENLKQNGKFTIVKKTKKSGKSAYGQNIDEKEMVAEGTLGQIQHIEEALSRVHEKKVKAVELKLKIITLENPDADDDAIADLASIIKQSARIVKENKERNEKAADIERRREEEIQKHKGEKQKKK